MGVIFDSSQSRRNIRVQAFEARDIAFFGTQQIGHLPLCYFGFFTQGNHLAFHFEHGRKCIILSSDLRIL